MVATIKDIAKYTGLGLATISSYLNGGNVREENRKKIEAAIKELNFEVNEVARGLKTNKTKTIGVVIPELNINFCTEIITAMEDVLRNHGYATIVCDCRTNKELEKNAVDFLFRKRVDGIINMPVNSDGSHLSCFHKAKKPIVLIDRKINGIECDYVLVDNLTAAKNAIQRLIDNGHKRIGMVGGPEDVFTAQERMLGYKLALMEAGIVPEDRLIEHGDYTINGGARCLEKLVKNNRDMTAVFVANHEMTMGAVIGINELGVKIPEELSVIGFDNTEFARACKPKLTIVTQPKEEIGKNVAELILKRIAENKSEQEIEYKIIKLQTDIMEGNSIRNLKK
ncbi:substrate-binding domain-containing protein [Anaerocolumna sedimenticola]|uniref:Substrate-binding domain-containing protein n=1 Tax=Anaerocolumna sedimenticola TaxID=2696063 RepID=A0A6P1TK95_9FIRM|nr:LacI family DNA-binding transcriptional regulator [Anaerocolumna sedimenticola]QHQ60853.1 substrate-binding domain-containing protein [Anaerocolumna sedimenticola]